RAGSPMFGPSTIGRSIVAGNAATNFAPDLQSGGGLVSDGYNLVGVLAAGIPFTPADTDLAGTDDPLDPRLGTLGDGGGPTQTIAPLAGSPAIDAIPAADCTV